MTLKCENTFPGVSPCGDNWEAIVIYKNERVCVGKYPDYLSAYHAYIIKCDELGIIYSKSTGKYDEYKIALANNYDFKGRL